MVKPALELLISIGQNNQKGLIDIYSQKSASLQGLAYSKCLYTFFVSTFYGYLLVYNIIYCVKCFYIDLDWTDLPAEQMLIKLSKFFEQDIIYSNREGIVG
jgi:hypothetical protein